MCLTFTASKMGCTEYWHAWRVYKERPFLCQIGLARVDPDNCQGTGDIPPAVEDLAGLADK